MFSHQMLHCYQERSERRFGKNLCLHSSHGIHVHYCGSNNNNNNNDDDVAEQVRPLNTKLSDSLSDFLGGNYHYHTTQNFTV